MKGGELASNAIQIKDHSWLGNNVVYLVVSPPATVMSHSQHQQQIEFSNEFRPFRRWVPWLVPLFVVANITLFIIAMHANNCPKNSKDCVGKFVRRFSFQPIKENSLLGPSSKTSLLSALFLQSDISVGASSALFGLLGGMLSKLITNWTIYANKHNLCSPTLKNFHMQLATLLTLVSIIVINLAIGILPHMDNFAHIGGFLSGFLLGFVFLIRRQFGWINQRACPPGYIGPPVKSKYKTYQYVLLVLSVILLIIGFTIGLITLLRGIDLNDDCSWCHYLSCIPISLWNCKSKQVFCESNEMGSQFILTCSSNGKTLAYVLPSSTPFQYDQSHLCSELCR